MLACVAGRPPHFEIHNAGIFAKPDVLFERRSTKGSAASDGAIDRARALPLVLDGQLDAGTDGRAIRLRAYELQTDPVVSVARIFEDSQSMAVPWSGAPDLEDDVLVTAAVQVGKRDSMPSMPLPGTGRSGDIDELLPAFVVKQNTGFERDIGGSSGSQENVEESIVINVAKVSAHRHVDLVETNFLSNIAKSTVTEVPIEFQSRGVMRKAQIRPSCFIQGKEIASCKDIG